MPKVSTRELERAEHVDPPSETAPELTLFEYLWEVTQIDAAADKVRM